MKILIKERFRNLIPPLQESEYKELKDSLIREGCREPLIVWNGILIDGHNRYKICRELGLPYHTIEMNFESEEEAVSWICSNQLGRRSISEETRRYLIGKRYEAEKIIGDRKSNRGINQYSMQEKRMGRPTQDYRHRTADKLGQEYHVSHSTIRNYSKFATVVDRLGKRTPKLATEILSGNVKISQSALGELVRLNDRQMDKVATNIEEQGKYVPYNNTRKEIREMSKRMFDNEDDVPPVKIMPKYDPDAEVVGLTLTIPSWASSIERVRHNIDSAQVSKSAKKRLIKALDELQNKITKIINLIEGDK